MITPASPQGNPEGPKNEEFEDVNLVSYFKNHSRDAIAYVLLILGIILLFFDPIYGGLLIGIISGIYFSQEILTYLLNWKEHVHSKLLARHLICAGILVAFFISAPAIFLGAAIAVGIKQFFIEPTKQ